MKVKFKKLHKDAKLPKYAKLGDAGMDLYPVGHPIIKEKYIEYDFGLCMELEEGYVGLIFPRSSISKTDLNLCNAIGVIDSGYRGNITARFNLNMPFGEDAIRYYDGLRFAHSNWGEYTITDEIKSLKGFDKFKDGDAILQLIIIPIPKIEPEWSEELSETERGENGYGSTDK